MATSDRIRLARDARGLSQAALATKPDLLVWPEAALPTMLRYHEDTAKAVIKALEAGKAYVNVHTAKNPAGEIRGQVKVSG